MRSRGSLRCSFAGLEQCTNLNLWNHRKNFVPTVFLVLNDSFLRFR